MTRHEGHIRQRSPGSYEIRYSLGTNPTTGRPRIVTATVRCRTIKEAEVELRKRLRERDLGLHADPSRMTVAQWLDRWLASIKDDVAPKTLERYSDIALGLLAPEIGKVLLAKLAPVHIQDAYNKWAVGGRRDGKPGGLSPRTRRHAHRILKSALSRAVKQNLLARNPADAFDKLPKVERKEMKTLDAEQSRTLLNRLRLTRLYWPTMLALTGGFRRGETLALRWKHIDFERGVVRVVESLEQTKAGLRFKPTKTDKGRAVALPAFAATQLRARKTEQAEELLRLGVRLTGDTLICARADGEPHQPRSLTHEFTRAIGRMKDLPRVRFHDLRHSHATQLLAAGVHPKIAQERLGHSTIVTTLDLYSHVSETMQKEAAAKIDAALGNG
jgi:integrase